MYHRIVCLTEEPTEILYRIGEEDRIVGISGFTVRPPRARKEKPKVSAFLSAKIDRILELEPDLALGFSDIQADIAAQLIRQGVEVHIFNHRSVAGHPAHGEGGGVPGRMRREGGAPRRRAGDGAGPDPRARRGPPAASARLLRGVVRPAHLRDPLGVGTDRDRRGEDCFPEHRAASLAKDRISADPDEVVRRAPT